MLWLLIIERFYLLNIFSIHPKNMQDSSPNRKSLKYLEVDRNDRDVGWKYVKESDTSEMRRIFIGRLQRLPAISGHS